MQRALGSSRAGGWGELGFFQCPQQPVRRREATAPRLWRTALPSPHIVCAKLMSHSKQRDAAPGPLCKRSAVSPRLPRVNRSRISSRAHVTLRLCL